MTDERALEKSARLLLASVDDAAERWSADSDGNSDNLYLDEDFVRTVPLGDGDMHMHGHIEEFRRAAAKRFLQAYAAEQVSEKVAAARAEALEEAAKLAEAQKDRWGGHPHVNSCADSIATAIRNLSAAPPAITGTFITIWRKPDNALEWDFHVSHIESDVPQVIGNLGKRGVREARTYRLGEQVEAYSIPAGDEGDSA